MSIEPIKLNYHPMSGKAALELLRSSSLRTISLDACTHRHTITYKSVITHTNIGGKSNLAENLWRRMIVTLVIT